MRHLGALRRAILSLHSYYREYSANPSMPLHTPTHPYPAVFTSQDGLVNHFTYLFQIKGQGRILFFGRMDNIEICIKFTTHYCKKAYEFLAAQGFAPKLHAVERLPGGLYIIIMDDVSKQYISLFDLIRDRPELLLKEYLDTRNTVEERQTMLATIPSDWLCAWRFSRHKRHGEDSGGGCY